MNTTTIIAAIGLFILGLLLGKLLFSNAKKVAEEVSNRFNYKICSELINHEIASENHILRNENQEFKEKIEFLKMLFIRQYIVECNNSKLNSGDHFIYTSDALDSMKRYAENAIKNYQDIWNAKPCNKYCALTEEFLNYLINWVTKIQKDNWAFFYIDDELESAFQRFFQSIQNSPTTDKFEKQNNRETDGITYWRPQGGGFYEES